MPPPGESEDTAGPLIEARGLTVRFGGTAVLDAVDLSVAPGEIVTLIGPNGSGKTTLARAVLGLLTPDAGTVAHPDDISIGYVPQQVQIDSTLPLTVERFIRLGGAADDAAVKSALEEVGVARLMGAPVHGLSGGEMRRVLLARALLRAPDLLVLDEPGAGVDVTGQAELYELIRTLRDRHGCGVLLISHNLHLVMAATDKVVCLNRHVCCAGAPESVTRNPEYLALFGDQAAAALAVYTHHHDHAHDLDGQPMPADDPAGTRPHG